MVTGAAGFVGQHLAKAFAHSWPDAALLRIGRSGEAVDTAADVTDAQAISSVVRDFRPDVIVHLAAVSHQSAAEGNPDLAWRVNLHGARRVGEAVLAHAPEALMIYASSAEVYGRSFQHRDRVDEDQLLQPANLYALTKAAGDLAIGELASRGLHTLRLRLFNCTGAGQTETFVVPAFARQIALIEAGRQAPLIKVGALDRWRDFLDVEDVCRAYVAAIEARARLDGDLVLNVCSGTPRQIGAILAELVALSTARIEVESDIGPRRGFDLPRTVGDPQRIQSALRWRPQTPWRETLTRVLGYWRNRVATAPF